MLEKRLKPNDARSLLTLAVAVAEVKPNPAAYNYLKTRPNTT